MKTKIIYISGNELFDIADIRAAFDTVRGALSLDKNTVLFGVPVDNDDAFAGDMEHNTETVLKTSESAPLIETLETEPVTSDTEHGDTDKKVKKAVRHRTARTVTSNDTSGNLSETDEVPTANEKTVIPILSVLETKSEQPHVSTPVEDKAIDKTTDDTTPIDIIPKADDTESVTISDMIADDTTPVDEHEKTLEELLETMTPLGEAKDPDTDVVTIDSTPIHEPEPQVSTNDSADVTLELLATEFAESEDKIVAPKLETRGKISKLKNILPFKKVKREDSGLMGDLFGWAGVANDEDFTIPGFFANASSKK